MAFSQRSWRVWEIGNEEENKRKRGIRGGWEEDRDTEEAFCFCSSTRIQGKVSYIEGSIVILHLPVKQIFAQPIFVCYPNFSWLQTEFYKENVTCSVLQVWFMMWQIFHFQKEKHSSSSEQELNLREGGKWQYIKISYCPMSYSAFQLGIF